jgi:ribonuclease HI
VSGEERDVSLMIMWRNWFVRNELTHGKSPPPVEVSKRFLESYLQSLFMIRQHPTAELTKGKQVVYMYPRDREKSKRQRVASDLLWSCPETGWMKVNVDGSFDAQQESGGIGVVMRNSEGRVIFAAFKSLNGCKSALEAELEACREGIVLASQWTMCPFYIESDCQVALQMIQGKEEERSELAYLIREIVSAAFGNREIRLRKIHRSQNSVSHYLANKGRCESLSKVWCESDCTFISNLVRTDMFPE